MTGIVVAARPLHPAVGRPWTAGQPCLSLVGLLDFLCFVRISFAGLRNRVQFAFTASFCFSLREGNGSAGPGLQTKYVQQPLELVAKVRFALLSPLHASHFWSDDTDPGLKLDVQRCFARSHELEQWFLSDTCKVRQILSASHRVRPVTPRGCPAHRHFLREPARATCPWRLVRQTLRPVTSRSLRLSLTAQVLLLA